MNILEMEDMVKGMPDQILMQEASAPSGRIPQFLALSEVKRRQEMRQRFQAQAAPDQTVKDQILQGIGAVPQGPQGPQGGPPMGPPVAPPMGPPPGPQGAPVMAYGGGMMPYRMFGGGAVPYRMQEGQTVPRTSRAQRVNELRDQIQAAILQGAPREQVDILRNQLQTLTAPAPLSSQAQDYQTFQRIREAGVFPQLSTLALDTPALEMPAPDFSAQIDAAIPQTTRGAAPASALPAPATSPTGDMAAAPATVPSPQEMDMGALFRQIRGNIGAGGGMPQDIGKALKPFEQYFAVDPNAPALQATDFSPLVQQAEKRGAERAASYAETIKNIESEMKRERLGAVLTTLGANLMAGEGAAGLEKAGALAQQMGKEARQEISAERRAARSAEESTADRIFALNAQQLTSNKEAQRAIFTAQQGVREKAFNALSKQMDNQQQAAQAASQLAATLTVGAVNSMRDKIVTEGANARAVLDYAQEQAKALKDTLGTATVGMSATEIQKLVEDTLRSAIITGYAAIGQAPPRGLEAQIRSAAAAGGTKGTTAQSGGSRFDVQVVPGR